MSDLTQARNVEFAHCFLSNSSLEQRYFYVFGVAYIWEILSTLYPASSWNWGVACHTEMRKSSYLQE